MRWPMALLITGVLLWVAMLFAGETTRTYALGSISAGDEAFSFYDDYVMVPEKTRWPYAVIASLGLFTLLAMRLVASTPPKPYHYATASISVVLIWVYWPATLLALALACAVLYPWRQQTLSGAQTWLWLVTLLLIASALRLEKLANVLLAPIQPDVQSMLGFAMESQYFYDTNYREPVWTNVIRFVNIASPSQVINGEPIFPAIRISTVFLSSLLGTLLFIAGRNLFNHAAGSVAALLFCINHAMVYRSIQGLRFELYAILLIVAILICVRLATDSRWSMRYVLLFVLAGSLIQLTRTSSFLFLGWLMLWILFHHPRSIGRLVLMGCGILVLTLPYYIYCETVLGNAMISSSQHLQFYSAVVFGTDPSAETTSASEIILSRVGLVQSTLYGLQGLTDTLIGRYALRLFYLPFSPVWILASCAGLLIWFWNRNWFWPVLILCNLGPMVFFLGLMNHTAATFDWRLLAHHFPMVALAAGMGFSHALAAVFPPPVPCDAETDPESH